MGDFTKEVREGNVAGPLRRAFTRKKWTDRFSGSTDTDIIDQNIHSAGLAIHEKLEAIRSVLKLSSSSEISATTKLRAFLAIANYDFFVTCEKTRQAIVKFHADREDGPHDVYTVEEMAAVKLKLASGFDFSPDEVIESIVDGIELPIRTVLQTKPSLAGNPKMSHIHFGEAARELNLGLMYRYAEDLWDECLWNDYRISGTGRKKVFVPSDLDILRSYRIGLARRNSLWAGFNIIASQFHHDATSGGAKMRVREVCGIERRGKRQIIKVSGHRGSTKAIEELSILRAYAAEPYYGELLDEHLEDLGGLTLSALIDAWTVLSSAAHVIVESMSEKHHDNPSKAKTHVQLPRYVSTLQVTALIDALNRAAGIKRTDGARIVEFFTFRGEPGQEIWAQPLVPVGPDTVAPVLPAMVSPNLRRLVDVWMRQAGIDLSRRGSAFEAHIRRLVKDAIRSSKILSPIATCIDHDYTFRPTNGRSEQIDLIFSIGNTIFVAETKCALEPTDAKGIAMHRKTVIGAADQVTRKIASLEDNRAAFVADAARFGMNLTESFKVVPLIIISTTTHVGVPAATVPVIDEYILGRFLDGEIEDIAYQPINPSISERRTAVFYTNATEAEANAAGYFASPPQMKRFIEGLRTRPIPIYAATHDDWDGYILTLDCVAGGTPLSIQHATSTSGHEDLAIKPLARPEDG